MHDEAAGSDARPRGRHRRSWWRRHRGVRAATALGLVLVLSVGVLLLTPLTDPRLAAEPTGVETVDEALALMDVLHAADDELVDPRCRSQVHHQGTRTSHAVVLLHGYTNCPAQFDLVAAAFAATGASVVVPRLPGHGHADRLSRSLSQVTAHELVATAGLALDVAAGLGEQVTVVGLSGGGALAGWLAAHRDEVGEVVLLAPLVAPRVLPQAAVAPVARLSRLTPDVYLWWDGDLREALAEPPYAYPRYSLRSIGAFLAVGRDAQSGQPARTTPLDRVVVVANPGDTAVSNAGVALLGRQLAGLLADDGRFVDYRVPAEIGARHDLIDPLGENAAILPALYAELAPLLELPDLQDTLAEQGAGA